MGRQDLNRNNKKRNNIMIVSELKNQPAGFIDSLTGYLYHGNKNNRDFWALSNSPEDRESIYPKFWKDCEPKGIEVGEKVLVTFSGKGISWKEYNGKMGLNFNPGYNLSVDPKASMGDSAPASGQTASQGASATSQGTHRTTHSNPSVLTEQDMKIMAQGATNNVVKALCAHGTIADFNSETMIKMVKPIIMTQKAAIEIIRHNYLPKEETAPTTEGEDHDIDKKRQDAQLEDNPELDSVPF